MSNPILIGQAEHLPEPEPAKIDLRRLQMAIEKHLEKIEAILGPDYALTLIASNRRREDTSADILLTLAERPLVQRAIDRWMPEGKPVPNHRE